VSQPPGSYRGQPQGQPPWNGYPPTGYPQTGYPPPGPASPSFTPAGPQRSPSAGSWSPQQPPPRRTRGKGPRKRNAALFIVAGICAIAAIAIAVGGNGNSAKHLTGAASSAAAKASSRAVSRASATAKLIAKAEDACSKKPPASGDIYVRMITPGDSAQAQRLGGEWVWDHVTNKCLTSVQMTIATAPLSAGNCTQVGYVADNPGYDSNAAEPALLADVAAQAGPACPAAAQSAPVQTTPAAAPAPPAPAAPPASTAPPASAAPAGCTPLSDEGTCYQPGEYCRDGDHGASGTAGDGETIVCEDNDGWRWEPA
jgi:hypothetical protein